MLKILRERSLFSFTNTVVIMSILAIAAKVAGFAEKMVIAHYFGTDTSSDIYFAVTGILFSMVFLVKELVHPALVPVLVKYLNKNKAVSLLLFKKFILFCGVIFICLYTLAAIFSNQLTFIFTPGFSPEDKLQTSLLLRYLSPACLFLSLSMVTYSTLNAFKKFLRASFFEAIYKVLVLIGLFALIPQLYLNAVPVVLLISSFIYFILMLWGVNEKVPFLVGDHAKLADLQQIFKLMAPIVIGVICSHISGIVDNALASTLPDGHLSYLAYSKKLVDAVLFIGPAVLVTVSYPHLSALWNQSRDKYVQFFVKVLRILVYLAVPAVVLITVLREPIVRFIFERGEFDAGSTAGTSIGLLIYGLGFLTFTIESHLVYSFYAFSDTKTPVNIGILCVILDIILAFSLLKWLGYIGIASAFVISKSVKVIILGVVLEKRLCFVNRDLIVFLLKTLLATGLSVFLLIYLYSMDMRIGYIPKDIVTILMSTLGFALVFVVSSMLMGIKEIQLFKAYFLNLLKLNTK